MKGNLNLTICRSSLLIVLSIFFTLSIQAKEVVIGKLKYKVNTTDKIAKCTGLAQEATKNYNLVIPSTVEYNGVTLKVTTVEKDAFWFDNYLKKVTLSDYTETIGSNAFADCDYLSIVSLGKKLKIIGADAFAHSGNAGTFTTLTLPATVEIIRDNAFLDCRSLTTISFGNKLLSIGNNAFWNCEGLKSIILPGSLQSIGSSAFACCDALAEVSFKSGSGNTVIGEKCFDNLKNLTVLNFFGPGVAVIGDSAFIGCRIKWVSLPSSVHTVGGGAFCCNNIENLELPEGLKVIGALAFNDQYGVGMKALAIPSTVTNIGDKAFYGVGDLETIVCNAVTPPVLGSEVFSYNPLHYSDLWVPQPSLEKYMNAPGWKDFQYINNTYTGINEIEIDYNPSDTEITIPSENTGDNNLEYETNSIYNEGNWFTLSGQRLNSQNLTPGIYIYIRNGKPEKRVIK